MARESASEGRIRFAWRLDRGKDFTEYWHSEDYPWTSYSYFD
jgi:hypothetical protein